MWGHVYVVVSLRDGVFCMWWSIVHVLECLRYGILVGCYRYGLFGNVSGKVCGKSVSGIVYSFFVIAYLQQHLWGRIYKIMCSTHDILYLRYGICGSMFQVWCIFIYTEVWLMYSICCSVFRHGMCSIMFQVRYMECRVWRIAFVYVIMCLIYGICSAVFLYVLNASVFLVWHIWQCLRCAILNYTGGNDPEYDLLCLRYDNLLMSLGYGIRIVIFEV